jgi:hypothetical protein
MFNDIFSQIECSLDEWASGNRTDVKFWASNYKSIYEDQMNMLDKFDSDTGEYKILLRRREGFFKAGWSVSSIPTWLCWHCLSKFAQVDHESEVVRTLSTDAVNQAVKEFKEGIDWDDDSSDGDDEA